MCVILIFFLLKTKLNYLPESVACVIVGEYYQVLRKNYLLPFEVYFRGIVMIIVLSISLAKLTVW